MYDTAALRKNEKKKRKRKNWSHKKKHAARYYIESVLHDRIRSSFLNCIVGSRDVMEVDKINSGNSSTLVVIIN